VGDATIGRWLGDGYLHRVLPGVYAVGHTAPSIDADLSAALLYAGPGAMLSHRTAAWWWGLTERPPPPIEVSVGQRRRSANGIRIHARSHRDRVWRRKLPLTRVEDTLLDCAVAASDQLIRRMLAEAEYHELLNIELLDRVLGRGRPGSAKLRRALRRYRPELAATRSELERAFLALCEAAELPLPRINSTHGRMTVDATWDRERVIVELDGYRGHRTRAQIERDRQRELRLRAAGYTVIRYSWHQIMRERELVIADLRAVLLGGLRDPARSS
jgi:very-short-patch-repair endonuclease